MPTLSDIRKKTSEITEKAIAAARRAASIASLRAQRSSVKSSLEDAYLKLGRCYYDLEKDEVSLTPESEEMIACIADLKERIAALDEEIASAKGK